MKLRTEIECIIATESSKTHTKIQKQRLEIIVIHYHYGRLVSILHSALAICNAPLVFSHLLLSTEHTPLVFVPRHAPLPLTPQTRLNAFPTSLSRKEETTESPSVKIT
jgi:hypothetical protein